LYTISDITLSADGIQNAIISSKKWQLTAWATRVRNTPVFHSTQIPQRL